MNIKLIAPADSGLISFRSTLEEITAISAYDALTNGALTSLFVTINNGERYELLAINKRSWIADTYSEKSEIYKSEKSLEINLAFEAHVTKIFNDKIAELEAEKLILRQPPQLTVTSRPSPQEIFDYAKLIAEPVSLATFYDEENLLRNAINPFYVYESSSNFSFGSSTVYFCAYTNEKEEEKILLASWDRDDFEKRISDGKNMIASALDEQCERARNKALAAARKFLTSPID